jgi:pimeloyl-ACP methyl ester carboxylesterase
MGDQLVNGFLVLALLSLNGQVAIWPRLRGPRRGARRFILACVAGTLFTDVSWCASVVEDVGKAPAVPKHVQFPTQDGGLIYADLYGDGQRGILLAHGGRFNKESWSDQARQLAAAGFHVLAINFRGYGDSQGPGQTNIFAAPLHLDVLAGVQYLRDNGAKTVAVVGGSMGGGAAAQASVSAPGQIDRLVLLGSTPDVPAEKLRVPKLYIMSRDDTSGDGPRLPGLRAHFEKAPEPKQLIILDGSAHAQFIFGTEHAERVMREILRFLSVSPSK